MTYAGYTKVSNTAKLRQSAIWGMPEDQFKELIEYSQVRREVLDYFGYVFTDSTWEIVKKRCHELNISIDHFKRHTHPTISDYKQLMVEHSTANTGSVKKYLLKNNLIENKCQICSLLAIWNGKPLVLRLDHINGIRDDFRRENLRLICANCDCQLPTFTGRNKKKLEMLYCIDCNVEIDRRGKRCFNCHQKNVFVTGKASHRKWPNPEEFQKIVREKGYREAAKYFDVAVSTLNSRIVRLKRYKMWPKEGRESDGYSKSSDIGAQQCL